MPKVSTTKAKTKPESVERVSVELMNKLSAKIGSGAGVITLGYAPIQEPTVLIDLAALVAPRFNAWRSVGQGYDRSGKPSEDAVSAAAALLQQFRDFELPNPGNVASTLAKGEIALPIDFPLFVFDTACGLRRAVVISGALELMTVPQLAHRLEKAVKGKSEVAELCTSSRLDSAALERIVASTKLSGDLDTISAALDEQVEVLTNALASASGLVVDIASQHEDELLISFLDWVAMSTTANGIFVAVDFHTVLCGEKAESAAQRRVKMLAYSLARVHRKLILAGPKIADLPREVAEGLIAHLELPLPSQGEVVQGINRRLASLRATLADRGRSVVDTLTEAELGLLHRAAQGLPIEEIEGILDEHTIGPVIGTQAAVKIDSSLIAAIIAAKVAKLAKLGVEFAPPADVQPGGMPVLKADLARIQRRFWAAQTPDAASIRLGVSAPKGLFITGITGTGKSLIAKAQAAAWGLPLLKLSIDSLFSKYVGGTGDNWRIVRDLIEGCAPCIVLIDEIDKALGGAASGTSGDSGTSDRLLGELLTWLQEKPPGVYIVATANDVSRIQAAKPELLRKGRWDNIYFVDVPTPEERAEILAGHLALHNSSFEASGMADAVAATANMVGAEIGYVVEASVDIALEEGRDYLIASDIVAIAADVQPVALATKSTVERLRAWAKANAKMANGEPATTAEHTSRRPEASEPIPSDRALLI